MLALSRKCGQEIVLTLKLTPELEDIIERWHNTDGGSSRGDCVNDLHALAKAFVELAEDEIVVKLLAVNMDRKWSFFQHHRARIGVDAPQSLSINRREIQDLIDAKEAGDETSRD